MRCLDRNKRKFYYCTYRGKEVVDSDMRVTYNPPVEMNASIGANTSMTSATRSAFSGIADYGVVLAYDYRIVTDDMNCPMDETSVLCINTTPIYNATSHLINYDFEVIKKAVGLDNITYYIKQVIPK